MQIIAIIICLAVVGITLKSFDNEEEWNKYFKEHDCIRINQDTVRCEQSMQEYIYIKRWENHGVEKNSNVSLL